jgi:hypothetical protein
MNGFSSCDGLMQSMAGYERVCGNSSLLPAGTFNTPKKNTIPFTSQRAWTSMYLRDTKKLEGSCIITNFCTHQSTRYLVIATQWRWCIANLFNFNPFKLLLKNEQMMKKKVQLVRLEILQVQTQVLTCICQHSYLVRLAKEEWESGKISFTVVY